MKNEINKNSKEVNAKQFENNESYMYNNPEIIIVGMVAVFDIIAAIILF